MADGGAGSRPAEPAAVEVAALRQDFGPATVLRDLSFCIRRGEIYGLIGPNGCGKTTIVNVISGLLAPSAGRVRVFGHDPRLHARAVHRLLGVVPQETSLYEELSAERNLRFHAELYGVPAREVGRRVTAMLRLAQLEERRRSRVSAFSGGMKRRLAIARALLHDPQLVYLDEPTLGVDVQARHVIWDYVRAMRRQGRTVLITTNYLDEGDALCDRMGVLDRGRLVAEGSPAELKRRYGSRVVEIRCRGALDPALRQALEGDGAVLAVEEEADQPGGGAAEPRDERAERGSGTVRALLRSGDGQEAAVPRLFALFTAHGVPVLGIQIREPTLDEVFLHLTGSAVRD